MWVTGLDVNIDVVEQLIKGASRIHGICDERVSETGRQVALL